MQRYIVFMGQKTIMLKLIYRLNATLMKSQQAFL